MRKRAWFERSGISWRLECVDTGPRGWRPLPETNVEKLPPVPDVNTEQIVALVYSGTSVNRCGHRIVSMS